MSSNCDEDVCAAYSVRYNIFMCIPRVHENSVLKVKQQARAQNTIESVQFKVIGIDDPSLI